MYIKFNFDQEAFIAHMLSKCVEKDGRRIFQALQGMVVLNAPAGTGKTTVVKHLAEKVYNTIVLAPTHKAVRVLTEGGDMRASTVHSFLGAKDDYDDDGNVHFKFRGPHKSTIGFLIIVDECSMLSEAMMKQFELLSKKNLILFVGDDLQLPPVTDKGEEGLSPKSKSFDIEDNWKLTENMRARDKRSTDMLQLARQACYNKRMPIQMPKQSIANVVQTFVDYQDTDKTAIVLAYSNVKVAEYNKKIRSKLFLKDGEEELQKYYVGEKLIYGSGRRVVDKLTHEGEESINGPENLVAYYSSHEVRVCEISRVTKTMNYAECNCDRTMWNRSRCIKHKFYKGTVDIEFWCIIDQERTRWYKPVDPSKLAPLQVQYKALCMLQKSRGAWREYYEWVNEYNADLKYNYAMTVHKSQGSEFHTVFVHRYNIERCTSRDQTLKVCGYYTAISRMREEVYDIVP